MSKTPVYLASSCVALLLAAGGALLFLLWQSWEESRLLERQNRELQASLEASRIRIENFCEYPADALCPTDTQGAKPLPQPSALASSGMTPEQPALQPVEKKGRQEKSKDGAPQPQNTAASQEEPLSIRPSAQPEPSPAISLPSEAKGIDQAPPPDTQAQPQEKAPAKETAALEGNKAKASSAENKAAEASATENKEADTFLHERPKRTWSTLEQGKEGMLFRIAGAGNELKASDERYSDSYDVILEGLWKVYGRQPHTPCVDGMQQSYKGGDTILSFPLRCTPEVCRIIQEDERTIAIEIR